MKSLSAESVETRAGVAGREGDDGDRRSVGSTATDRSEEPQSGSDYGETEKCFARFR